MEGQPSIDFQPSAEERRNSFLKRVASAVFSKQHRVFTVIAVCSGIALCVAIVIIVSFNSGQNNTEPLYTADDYSKLDALAQDIYMEGFNKTDEEAKEFYKARIESEKDIVIKNSIIIKYAADLKRRGFVYTAIDTLKTVAINDLTCLQEVDMYTKYRDIYTDIGDEILIMDYENKLESAITQCEEEGWVI